MKRSTYLIILAVSSSFVLFFGCSRSENSLQGYVESDTTYLAAPLSGKLDRLSVERGQLVKTGDELFHLDEAPESFSVRMSNEQLKIQTAKLLNLFQGKRELALKQYETQVEESASRLLLAKQQHERIGQLYQSGSVTTDALNAAENTLHVAKAEYESAQALFGEAKLGARQHLIEAQQAGVGKADIEGNQSQWLVEQKKVVAPNDGVVLETFFTPGEQVQAYAPVVSMLQKHHVHIVFYVPEPSFSSLHLNDKIDVRCGGCAGTTVARVSWLSPTLEYTPPMIYSSKENPKYVFKVRAEIPTEAEDYMHPGQPVSIFLTNHGASNAQ